MTPHSMSHSDAGSDKSDRPISTWCPLSQAEIYDMFGMKTALQWQAQSALIVEARWRKQQGQTFTAGSREARQHTPTGTAASIQRQTNTNPDGLPSRLPVNTNPSPSIVWRAAPKASSSWATTIRTRPSLAKLRENVTSTAAPTTITMQPPSEPYSTADWTEDEQTPLQNDRRHERSHNRTVSVATQGES